jgi:hypothetical protein
MSQQPEPEGEFILFPELPTELQLLCWKFAIPPSSIIKINCLTSEDTSAAEDEDVRLSSSTHPSALLSTCRNSRQMLLERNTSVIKMNILGGRKMFFDADNDIVVLGPKEQWGEDMVRSKKVKDAGIFSEVKTLAVSLETVKELHKSGCVATQFTNLQVLLMVYQRPLEYKNASDWVPGICFERIPEKTELAIFENFMTLIRFRMDVSALFREGSMKMPDIKARLSRGWDSDWV